MKRHKTLCISVTHFSLLSSFESEEKNPLRDISLRQNYESLIGEMNLRLVVSRTWTCQKSVFFLCQNLRISPKSVVKFVSPYFWNMGSEGWKIAGWQESRNNIDILEPQNYYHNSISLEFGHVLTS